MKILEFIQKKYYISFFIIMLFYNIYLNNEEKALRTINFYMIIIQIPFLIYHLRNFLKNNDIKLILDLSFSSLI